MKPVPSQIARVIYFVSLPEKDLGIANRLYEHVEKLVERRNNIEIQSVNVEDSRQFKNELQDLAFETRNMGTPLVHIEAHGGAEEGLILKDGSTMEWIVLSRLLSAINQQTLNRMIVVSNVCCSL